MVWCGVVWCGVVWCGVVWCGVVWCGVVWCDVVCQSSEPVRSPVTVDALNAAFPVRSIAAGEKHSLAVSSDVTPHPLPC
jgi:hypothetical protein